MSIRHTFKLRHVVVNYRCENCKAAFAIYLEDILSGELEGEEIKTCHDCKCETVPTGNVVIYIADGDE